MDRLSLLEKQVEDLARRIEALEYPAPNKVENIPTSEELGVCEPCFAEDAQ